MSDDYNSIINGQDDYTNRIVSSKAGGAAPQASEGGVGLVRRLESLDKINQAPHSKESFPQANIPAPSKGKDPF